MPTPASTVGSSIPELWNETLQRALRKSLRFANVCNTKYEGEIREKGDTVRITTVGDVTIDDYSRNTDITLQTLTTTDLDLVIDQARSYGFFWDLLDQTQTATPGIMQEATDRAAYNMRDEVDSYIAGLLDDGTAAANVLTAAGSVGLGGSDQDAFEILVDLAAKLEENNVPEGDRWVVVPPWYAGMMKKDPRRSSFGTVPNIEQYQGGLLGIDKASGLQVWVSNNVPVDGGGTDYSIIAGYPDAVTFANQLTQFKMVENPQRFGDNCLGVMAYGGKVTRPYGLAKIVATQAT